MVAYLQVINNPHDDVRLSRIINVPKRSIGAKTVANAAEIAAGLGESIYSVIKNADDFPALSRASAKLKEFVKLIDGLIEAEQSGDYSLAELYNLILEHTNYTSYLKNEKENADVRIENIEELLSNVIKFEEDYGDEADLSSFLEEISLQTDIDNYDANADTCVMMTLHSAKGLEFPVVFITGMEDGIFPSYASIMNPDEIGRNAGLRMWELQEPKKNSISQKPVQECYSVQQRLTRLLDFSTKSPTSLLIIPATKINTQLPTTLRHRLRRPKKYRSVKKQKCRMQNQCTKNLPLSRALCIRSEILFYTKCLAEAWL